MKITLNFEDVKKLIEESYDGIKDVTTVKDGFDILLEVDGDDFKRKKLTTTPSVSDTKVDYDKLLEKKSKLRKEITGESIIPQVKTIEDKNKEAKSKGLMATGRGSERVLTKF